jgi:hypothetical protein
MIMLMIKTNDLLFCTKSQHFYYLLEPFAAFFCTTDLLGKQSVKPAQKFVDRQEINEGGSKLIEVNCFATKRFIIYLFSSQIIFVIVYRWLIYQGKLLYKVCRKLIMKK